MSTYILLNTIEKAADVVGKTWPLYSFVTSNPLSGYENTHFINAVKKAQGLTGSRVFPDVGMFKQAWELGEIDATVLNALLIENGMTESPAYYLDQLEAIKYDEIENPNHRVDKIMVKWLSVFMDEGLAEWQMPNKEKGFYKAWSILASYDKEIGKALDVQLPKTNTEALEKLLNAYSEQEQQAIFEYHLAALPGWTGYIKFRAETNSLWEQKYSITLTDYLAVRLWVSKALKASIVPPKSTNGELETMLQLQYVWLKAWEKSWQQQFVTNIKSPNTISKPTHKNVPDAQFVFCIDTRSELIRRNIESKGNYETFGYAGFFGIAMDYTQLEDGISRKSCPPILGSAYQVSETAQEHKTADLKNYKKSVKRAKFTSYFLVRMKNMLPSAFGYVEGSGIFYGMSLLIRTLFPGSLYQPQRKNEGSFENSCTPQIGHTHTKETSIDIPLEEKVAIVKTAFDLTGWRTFAPVVVFAGHGSHSANNPFGSSLDCGACAASPGRHNARMLAKLANLSEVRKALRENHDIRIPEDTVFIGAEHNTTTDEIVLFDAEVPPTHAKRLSELKVALLKTQETATQERLGVQTKSIAAAHVKTNNWSETRPEWGLAKNAGFVIGSRELTKNMNLGGHCFLHSYDWELDIEAAALEAIMQGPMVVTQWINNHYYFATVDNHQYGGGSKIAHNITGKFGVVQGNGSDLKAGLPLQSVNETDDKMYHRPLRLSVLIQAPKERVQAILEKFPHLKALLDNEWIYLMVMDPTEQNEVSLYEEHMVWKAPEKVEVFAEMV
ncbi:DUF2309 domain-containing protein [Cellulophaga sp. Hel_I_12]|uniref:DUF2309 domain-containing protein n=1 Tax=Cellulophaga sp. Hel_I_12 TaxID=1249972 RepID=UPI000648600C|nr:DUF2309 domain-containing protein [Cellulophaga sp. Hel_I_12]